MLTTSSYSHVPAPDPDLEATLVSHDGLGAGVTVVPPGARSITVTVVEGTVSMQISGGPAQTLPVGIWTWGVDHGGEGGERLADTFSASGGVGDVWTLHTTREV